MFSFVKYDGARRSIGLSAQPSTKLSMIREAHIGIGLFGNEGMSAVQSSVFATLRDFFYLGRKVVYLIN